MASSFLTKFIDFLLKPGRFIRRRTRRTKKFLRKRLNGFSIHEKMVDRIYGPVSQPYCVAQISNGLFVALTEWIASQDNVSLVERYHHQIKSRLFCLSEFPDPNVLSTLDRNMTWYPPMKRGPLRQQLHDELRELFRTAVQSPFAIVNTKAWSTKPNTEQFGPTRLHTDKFEPGHLKVMVYLQPLNQECGSLRVAEHVLADERDGVCVLLNNSDVLHAGVPGTSRERVLVEVTLFRSLFNIRQFHAGHINARHYKRATTAYLGRLATVLYEFVAIVKRCLFRPRMKYRLSLSDKGNEPVNGITRR